MPVTTFVQSPHNERNQKDSIYGGIHHPIDRKDWYKHPGAQECINGEAQGLIANYTWDYSKVVPRKEPINVGRLMTLLSIKHLTPELRNPVQR